jgi:peptide/nickel transport system ATP-binding protein
MSAPLLDVRELSVRIGSGPSAVAALSGVDLRVERGEVVGLVGESGGGKSMLARSVIGLLPDGSHTSGRVELDGADVLTMSPAQLRRHRGRGAALCFQNPRSALSPVRTVGRQLTDRLEAHQRLTGKDARAAALALFDQVGIRNPRRRFDSYPHELSGGMCQRVMIALALGCAPALLLADEPTTGLDVTLTKEILGLFRRAADEEGRGVLLISHDLASVGTVCDRVVVLYAGTVVETGATAELLRAPAHPYTRALVRSVPELDGVPVRATAGTMPLLHEPPRSCPFAPRCDRAEDDCRSRRPPLAEYEAGAVACFHPASGPAVKAIVPAAVLLKDGVAAQPAAAIATLGLESDAPALRVDGVGVAFAGRFGSSSLRALHDVSFTVARGESVGVVGESGCGKSTLARVITGLQASSAGSVAIEGRDVAGLSRAERRQLHRRVQMVFQDPQGALSPRRSVLDAVSEPLRMLGLSKSEMRVRAEEAIQQTGLDSSVLGRRPSQLSGGQAQRVGIARALVVDPQLVVLDEPTSALDVTVQAQVLELIKGLAAERTRSFVFISHDLATVRGFCDRVVVLYLGRVVEEGPVEQVFANPLHPYTRALLASAPRLRSAPAVSSIPLVRDIEQAEAPVGCPLTPRCPYSVAACHQPQDLHEYAPGQRAACQRIPEIVSGVAHPSTAPGNPITAQPARGATS